MLLDGLHKQSESHGGRTGHRREFIDIGEEIPPLERFGNERNERDEKAVISP